MSAVLRGFNREEKTRASRFYGESIVFSSNSLLNSNFMGVYMLFENNFIIEKNIKSFYTYFIVIKTFL